MNFSDIIFFAIFLIFAGYILLFFFTEKGRNLTVRIYYGAIIHDYGILGKEKVWFGVQKIRLLQCQRGDEVFYVLETIQTGLASFQISYTKIGLVAGEKIVKIIQKKNDNVTPAV